MDKYIKIQDIESFVERYYGDSYTYLDVINDMICQIPAADVVPVRHRRWILKDDGRAHCSECDTAGNSYVWHYCPNCGAKMDGDGD